MKRVTLDLTEVDGNAFALMGAFKQRAQKEGWSQSEIGDVLAECQSGDYDHLVATLAERCVEESEPEEEEGRVDTTVYDPDAEPQTSRGRWKYLGANHGHSGCDSEAPSLVLADVYGFDFSRIKDDGLMHWLQHMSLKDWVTDEDLGALIRLMRDLNELL